MRNADLINIEKNFTNFQKIILYNSHIHSRFTYAVCIKKGCWQISKHNGISEEYIQPFLSYQHFSIKSHEMKFERKAEESL